jgi:hypothetical protein
MSEQSTEVKATDEKENKVVVSAEDCSAALDFWKHFNIPLPTSLEKAVEAFSKDPSFLNQEAVKLELCKAISTTDHEAFRDEMFSKIVEECGGVAYDMTFDRELDETLAVSNTQK